MIFSFAATLIALPCFAQTPEETEMDSPVFAKINGVVVTQDEYIKQLERQTVNVPGGQPTNAERVVLDQLVSNIVIIAEAKRLGVAPTDAEVDKMFTIQKKLFAAQFPGKDYDTAMREQGTTPEEIKNDLRVQLAETALYVKLLKLSEAEVRSTYNENRTSFGLAARVQMRLIVAKGDSLDFRKVKAALASGQDFDSVAKRLNPPQMRGTGGLLPQPVPVNTLTEAMQSKVMRTPEGQYFGAVDFQQKGVKAWIKIEKRLPEFKIPFEDAAPLVCRQMVQLKLSEPKNQAIRNSILQKKMAARFEASATYQTVWDAVKEAAVKAGVGSSE
ncbi:MAG: SurA N-terminal domain-containing protein [Armatimonadetes bacterium]|nr:SurA N-terminal domain-containing protein [Armatimonadota bacterium]